MDILSCEILSDGKLRNGHRPTYLIFPLTNYLIATELSVWLNFWHDMTINIWSSSRVIRSILLLVTIMHINSRTMESTYVWNLDMITKLDTFKIIQSSSCANGKFDCDTNLSIMQTQLTRGTTANWPYRIIDTGKFVSTMMMKTR